MRWLDVIDGRNVVPIEDEVQKNGGPEVDEAQNRDNKQAKDDPSDEWKKVAQGRPERKHLFCFCTGLARELPYAIYRMLFTFVSFVASNPRESLPILVAFYALLSFFVWIAHRKDRESQVAANLRWNTWCHVID